MRKPTFGIKRITLNVKNQDPPSKRNGRAKEPEIEWVDEMQCKRGKEDWKSSTARAAAALGVRWLVEAREAEGVTCGPVATAGQGIGSLRLPIAQIVTWKGLVVPF